MATWHRWLLSSPMWKGYRTPSIATFTAEGYDRQAYRAVFYDVYTVSIDSNQSDKTDIVTLPSL